MTGQHWAQAHIEYPGGLLQVVRHAREARYVLLIVERLQTLLTGQTVHRRAQNICLPHVPMLLHTRMHTTSADCFQGSAQS